MPGAERRRDRRPGAALLPGAVARLLPAAGVRPPSSAVARLLPVAVLLVLVSACGAAGPAPRDAAPATSLPSGAGVAAPTSVRIPAIGVDEHALVRLGVAADGTAQVPQDHDRVGWFDRGGAPGPTVLMGHVDSRDGPAVFYDLRDLQPGDVIEVGRDDGTVGRYVVERTRQMPKDAFPTFDVFGAAAPELLRLVTCAGGFDRGERSYTDNLVVHARPA